jgi:DNA-binding CsgD family transcriptional regulator
VAPVPAAPLVGRDTELAALRAATDDAHAGTARCVVVAGEAGIGKTRLVTDALAELVDARVLTGHGADMSTGEIPFGVLADTLRDLRRQAGDDVLTRTERASLAPLLPAVDDPGHGDRARMLAGALDLLARLADQRLLVWVVEDVHWADAATRDLVNLAVRSLHGHLLTVLTFRAEDPDRSREDEAMLSGWLDGLTRLPHVTRLDLPRLTHAQTHRQLHDLGAGLSPEEARTVVRLADGIPFLVEELAAAHDHSSHDAATAAVAHRIHSLDSGARRLVDVAAIGEGHLRISLLAQVLDASPDELDTDLLEAVAAGVLTSEIGSDRLGFRHALLRDATLRGMGPGARRGWHRRWAEVLDASQGVLAPDPAALAVAEHWHHAGDAARAAQAAYAALPAARRTSDATRQVALWTSLLEAWDHRDPGTPAGRLSLRDVLGALLAHPAAANVGRPLWEGLLSAVPRQDLGRVEQTALAVLESMIGRSDGGRPYDPAALQDALVACDWSVAPPDTLTRTMLAVLGSYLPPEADGVADVLADRAAKLADDFGDEAVLLALALGRAIRASVRHDYDRAVTLLEKVLHRLSPEDVERRLLVLGNLVCEKFLLGQHAEADMVLARERGLWALSDGSWSPGAVSPMSWEHLTENASTTWICSGQWERARRHLEDTAHWWYDDLRMSNFCLARLDLLQHGRTDEDRWHLHLDSPIHRGPGVNDVRRLLALAAGLRGDSTSMRDLALQAWASPHDDGPDEWTWFLAADLLRIEADTAVVDHTRRTRAQGLEHVARLEERLRSIGAHGPLTRAYERDLAAQLDRFHGRDARESLQAALAGWQAIGHVPDVAATHLSLAEAHAIHGDRDTARHHLTEARHVAADLGAGPMLDRASALADRYALDAHDTTRLLTDRETEVLTLLAEGRTNKEIAQALFMAPKTASVHVSRILTKLGATNRTEAATLARRRGVLPRGSEDRAG